MSGIDYLLQIIERIRALNGLSFVIGVKLNSTDYEVYYSLEETKTFLRRLAKIVDFIEISGGDYDSPGELTSPRVGIDA